MELGCRGTRERLPTVEVAAQLCNGLAVHRGGDTSDLRQQEQACRHVEHSDGRWSAEDVERPGARESDRDQHRAQYADLRGALHQRLRKLEVARIALEPE